MPGGNVPVNEKIASFAAAFPVARTFNTNQRLPLGGIGYGVILQPMAKERLLVFAFPCSSSSYAERCLWRVYIGCSLVCTLL